MISRISQTGDRGAPLTPLSFPQFLAGIQCLSLLALHSCGPALSCRECRFALSGQTGDRVAPLTPLSFPQFLAGIQCFSRLSFHSCEFALSCRECRFALSGSSVCTANPQTGYAHRLPRMRLPAAVVLQTYRVAAHKLLPCNLLTTLCSSFRFRRGWFLHTPLLI